MSDDLTVSNKILLEHKINRIKNATATYRSGEWLSNVAGAEDFELLIWFKHCFMQVVSDASFNPEHLTLLGNKLKLQDFLHQLWINLGAVQNISDITELLQSGRIGPLYANHGLINYGISLADKFYNSHSDIDVLVGKDNKTLYESGLSPDGYILTQTENIYIPDYDFCNRPFARGFSYMKRFHDLNNPRSKPEILRFHSGHEVVKLNLTHAIGQILFRRWEYKTEEDNKKVLDEAFDFLYHPDFKKEFTIGICVQMSDKRNFQHMLLGEDELFTYILSKIYPDHIVKMAMTAYTLSDSALDLYPLLINADSLKYSVKPVELPVFD